MIVPDPNWPDPDKDPLGHTLALYPDMSDDEVAITATSGVYGVGVRTGLTWGDLRRLYAALEVKS